MMFHNFKKFILPYCVFFIVPALSFSPAVGKTLEDYTALLAEHPQVVQMLEESDIRASMSKAATGLPDPMLMLGLNNLPVENPSFSRDMMTSKMIGFSQMIPSYRLRRANADKQEILSKKQQLAADYVHNRLSAILISMLARHRQIAEQQGYAAQQLTHYRELENHFKGRLDAGARVYWRFSQVDVERSMVEQRLNDLKAEKEETEAELIRLVGDVPDIVLPEIKEKEWDENPATLYPLLLAGEDVFAASKDVDAAKAAFGPNYTLGASYMQRGHVRGMDADDMMTVQAGISIPLWYGRNQEPKLQAAKAGQRSAEAAREDAARQWMQKMSTLAAKRDAAADNIRTLEQRNKALKELVAAAERDYESGQAGLDMMLDARINRLNIAAQLAAQKARHIMLTAEYNSHIPGGETP